MNRCTHTSQCIMFWKALHCVRGMGEGPCKHFMDKWQSMDEMFLCKNAQKSFREPCGNPVCHQSTCMEGGLVRNIVAINQTLFNSLRQVALPHRFFLASDVYLTPITTIIYFQARRNCLDLFCYIQYTLHIAIFQLEQ